MRAAALEPVLAVRVVAVCSASIRVLLYLEMLLNEANLLKRHTLDSTFLSQPSPVRAAALPRRLPPSELLPAPAPAPAFAQPHHARQSAHGIRTRRDMPCAPGGREAEALPGQVRPLGQ